MIKDAIGILDMGLESFNILPTLVKNFKHEKFIYINDLKNQPYEGMKVEDILAFVKHHIDILMQEDIKLLIVVSDMIVEYCSDFLHKITIPVINIVSTLIDYVNEKYEQKNIVLLAKSSIIDANLYQKNFKYNHLYNIPSNDLEDLISSKMVKTSKSFHSTKEALKPILKKDVDVIVTSSPFLYNLKTEILEYIKIEEITNIGDIICNQIRLSEIPLYEKGRGKVIVYSNIKKKEFKERAFFAKFKYKIIEFDLAKLRNIKVEK